MRAVLREKLNRVRSKFQRKLADQMELDLQDQQREVPRKSEVGTDPEREKDVQFLELFAGEAGLTRAVKRRGIAVPSPGDVHTGQSNRRPLDLTKLADFKELKKLIKKKQVRWVHFAPPCRTFPRARRTDQLMKLRRLRTEDAPEGLNPKPDIVKEARKSGSASFATVQSRRLLHDRESRNFTHLEIQASSQIAEVAEG